MTGPCPQGFEARALIPICVTEHVAAPAPRRNRRSSNNLGLGRQIEPQHRPNLRQLACAASGCADATAHLFVVGQHATDRSMAGALPIPSIKSTDYINNSLEIQQDLSPLAIIVTELQRGLTPSLESESRIR
jgi:hypothetical protein